MTIPEKLNALRVLMAERKIDYYLIPTCDFHQAEYVDKYFKARAFMSGFTGSAGILIVGHSEAALWTDGRYFLQAEKQLKDSTIDLMKMGQEGVPTVEAYLKDKLPDNGCLGFDGRVVSSTDGKAYAAICAKKQGSVHDSEDLVDLIWVDRPAMSATKVYDLPICYCGESREDKLARVREAMKKEGADVHVLTSLDDIAWLMNLRGNDVSCNPVFFSNMIIDETSACLFIQNAALTSEVKAALDAAGVSTADYKEFYSAVEKIPAEKKVLLHENAVSYAMLSRLGKDRTIIDRQNPAMVMKAVKNAVEQENMRKAHIIDGVALSRFIRWVKETVPTVSMTEVDASDKLEEFRKEGEGFLDLSFDTICGYGTNGAIVHYTATPEDCATLEPKGMVLVDSGAQYYTGTTDVTRTIVLGELSYEEKRDFTLVLKGMLNLANIKFVKGISGVNLDVLARRPMWEMGMDYNHGTGHGIGYLLNVHEGPNAFRWRVSPGRREDTPLEPGMITSDEPGLYIAGSHGIRTENLILCVEKEKNEFGHFLGFEYLTLAPIDKEAVLPELMSAQEIKWLDEYHALCWEKLSPYLSGDDLTWFKNATAPLLG